MVDSDFQIGVGGGGGGGLRAPVGSKKKGGGGGGGELRASVWSKNKGGLALPLDPPLISDVNDTSSSG